MIRRRSQLRLLTRGHAIDGTGPRFNKLIRIGHGARLTSTWTRQPSAFKPSGPSASDSTQRVSLYPKAPGDVVKRHLQTGCSVRCFTTDRRQAVPMRTSNHVQRPDEVTVQDLSTLSNRDNDSSGIEGSLNISKGSPVDIMVVGSTAVDFICTVPNIPHSIPLLHNSHPAKIKTSAGGVAHNVALATSYATSNSVRLVTTLGADPEGAWLRGHVENSGLDVAVIPSEMESARVVAIHNKDGELVVAYADMSIIEAIKGEDIRVEIRNGKPKYLAFDGYLSPAAIESVLRECGPVLFEPTTALRAATIFQKPVELGIFPNQSIDIITPNLFELKNMFNAAQGRGYFEGPEWWSLFNSFELKTHFRQDVESLLRRASRRHRHGSLDDPTDLEYNATTRIPEDALELKLGRDVMEDGALHQAVALLPYIPNIFVKLGTLGVLSVRLLRKDSDMEETNESALRFPGSHGTVVVQHHPGLPQKAIVSVTGAGDTFSGVLISKLVSGCTIDQAVDMAQKAVVMTLTSPRAVSEQIRELK